MVSTLIRDEAERLASGRRAVRDLHLRPGRLAGAVAVASRSEGCDPR